MVSYYGGTIDLMPDSDIWVDQVVLKAKNSDLTTYTNTASQLSASEFDSRVGYSPVVWGAWKNNWLGKQYTRKTSWNVTKTNNKQTGGGFGHFWRPSHQGGSRQLNHNYNTPIGTKITFRRDATYVGRKGTATRTGTKKLVKETFSTINEGPKVINTQIISNLRSRNIRFNASTLKPSTGIYAFFDGQDMSKYILSLIHI